MSTYVLVHGAWHGAWSWNRVVPLLEQAGHTVVTFDLPGHGADKTPIPEVTLQAYADRICQAVNAQAEPVILVGHSMGGIPVSQAAEQCPDNIKKLVYLNAFMIRNGETLLQHAQQDTEALVPPNLVMADDESYLTLKDEGIIPAFYNDCTAEDAAWAKAQLTPQPFVPFVTPLSISEENYGRLPRVYISCLQDQANTPTAQKAMYTALPCEKVITMNASHSPFLSMPEELVGHLLTV